MPDEFAAACLSLAGLATGDAFGELFFRISVEEAQSSGLPKGPWPWTDDTHMAISIVEVLRDHRCIEQDALAAAFARRYREDPQRGYGGGAAALLRQIVLGADWRQAAPKLFGEGSFGNGAAMRVAPVGGFFQQDVVRAAREARLSAEITHAHPEGIAGAIAVAVAAALAANAAHPSGPEFVAEVAKSVPESLTRERLRQALDIPPEDIQAAVRVLGSGREVSAQDTVPFCVWSAAHHLDDFAAALWATVAGLGDRDTTCAIVGGIVALSAPEIPPDWVRQREALPAL